MNSLLEMILKLYVSTHQFAEIGKISQEVAEKYYRDENYVISIKNYKKASEYFMMVEQYASFINCTIKLAELYIKMNDYEEAFELYCALQNNKIIVKHKMKEYQFHAFLCKIAMFRRDAKDELIIECEILLASYVESETYFNNSNEHELCKMILDTIANENEKQVQMCINFANDNMLRSTELFHKAMTRIIDQINDIR